ncbi:MAG TPA: single-stranded-DNA-specific exonuclease RecJ [Spirochaetota bacterium]|nr:single-stranded-DNA-specific exonuclease RecJ [Spirochaetota bacterium]
MNILKEKLDLNFIKKWQDKGFETIILSILDRRNIKTESEVISFLYPEFELLDSPFLYSKIISAYQRLDRAIKNRESIIIFGDRDVDGTTSIAILVDFLKRFNAKVDWELPVGIDNYGLSMDKVNKWRNKYSLCITVDCGITNISEIKELKNNGIDTIIIDHHSPLEIIPEAYAIINPKCEDSIDFKNVAASGVTFLFIFGYIFYKSQFYNKNILFIYESKNSLKLNLYRNLILIENVEFKDKLPSFIEKIDFIFYDLNNNKIKNFILKFLNNKKCYHINNFDYLKEIDVAICEHIIFLKNLFNLIHEIENIKTKYLPLTALGTIADIMPIININRIFVANGLKFLNKLKNITELCKRVEVDCENITVKDLSWCVCPLLNASGRMGDATITVLFLMDNDNYNFYIQSILDNNKERKIHEEFAINTFKDECENNKNFYNNNLAFFYSDKIHRGITGIAAAKLSSKTNCPTIVAAKEGDFFIGSIRGKSNYHFVEFLDTGKEFLLEYGGHHSAAGFRFHKDKLEDFIIFLKENSHKLNNEIKEDDFIKIDAEIPEQYLNYDLFKTIFTLEPFGEGNPPPILLTKNIKINSWNFLGKDKKHIKIYFNTIKEQIIGILWNKAEFFNSIYSEDKRYNILYQLELNKFNNQVIPQLIILDIEICD